MPEKRLDKQRRFVIKCVLMNKEVYSRSGVDLFLRNGAVMRLGSCRSPSFYAYQHRRTLTGGRDVRKRFICLRRRDQ